MHLLMLFSWQGSAPPFLSLANPSFNTELNGVSYRLGKVSLYCVIAIFFFLASIHLPNDLFALGK